VKKPREDELKSGTMRASGKGVFKVPYEAAFGRKNMSNGSIFVAFCRLFTTEARSSRRGRKESPIMHVQF
jgi:hypothetical protein